MKGRKEVTFEAIDEKRRRLPFPLPGLDSDNESEFIKDHLYNYCLSSKLTL